jgi:hypothetical protein
MITAPDLDGFAWAARKSIVDVNVTSDGGASMETLLYKGEKREFKHPFTKDAFVLKVPVDAGDFTLTGKLAGDRPFAYTYFGPVPAGGLKLALAPKVAAARAAEIHVKTDPEGAEVLLNTKLYHEPSNFESSQEPGPYVVVIRKLGYKDHVSQKVLEKREVWKLGVTLKKN